MQTVNNIIAVIMWLGFIVLLMDKSSGVGALLFFFPFCMANHLISHIAVFRLRGKSAQSLVTVALAGYFGWFCFIYYNAFYVNLDPQSAIALVFVGPIALVVLVPLWLAAYSLSRKDSSGTDSSES